MVAVEDWMRAVTARPSRNAVNGLLVTCSIAAFRALEELSFRPSPMRRIPYRNIARPPNSVSRSKMLIIDFPRNHSLLCNRIPSKSFLRYTAECPRNHSFAMQPNSGLSDRRKRQAGCSGSFYTGPTVPPSRNSTGRIVGIRLAVSGHSIRLISRWAASCPIKKASWRMVVSFGIRAWVSGSPS